MVRQEWTIELAVLLLPAPEIGPGRIDIHTGSGSDELLGKFEVLEKNREGGCSANRMTR